MIELKIQTLYIVSGLSCSGKSEFLLNLIKKSNLSEDCILSLKSVKKMMYGNNIIENVNNEYVNESLKSMFLDMVRIRMKQGLITFVESNFLTDKSRNELYNIANQENVKTKILILNKEDQEIENNINLISNNYIKNNIIDNIKIEKTIFQKTSKIDYIEINKNNVNDVIVLPNLIDTTNIDIVGDTHGLLDDLKILLSKNGWKYEDNVFKHVDKEKKLLFLGDVLDRGPDGFKILDIIINMSNDDKAYFLMGNHENKFLNLLMSHNKNELLIKRSIAGAITFRNYLKLSSNEKYKYYNFLKNSPLNYSLWINKDKLTAQKQDDIDLIKIGFGHGDIILYNDYTNLKSNILYGNKAIGENKERNNDEIYNMMYENGLNKHIYIRGHYPEQSKEKSVYSLDNKCAFSGDMKMLDLKKYITKLKENKFKLKYELFEESSINQKIKFNFNNYIKTINIEEETNINNIVKKNDKYKK